MIKQNICDIGFSSVTLREAAEAICQFSGNRQRHLAVPINVDVLMLAKADPQLSKICDAADLVVADGMPIVWLSRLIGKSLPERVTGADLLPLVCSVAAEQRRSVLFLGGKPGATAEVARQFRESYPGIKIAGALCPPFGFERDQILCGQIVRAVNEAKPDILFIGLGAPKQEKWLWTYREKLDFGVALCVGAAFDFSAGFVKRAPMVFQRTGLEWLWRLIREPRRLWRRYILRDMAFIGLAARFVWKSKFFSQGAK